MIQNRTAQLVWQSFFLGIAVVGISASLGLFDMAFRWDFYIYFTNLSNYLCIAIITAQLIATIKRSGNAPISLSPVLKLASLVGILVTFLIYNFLLAREPGRDLTRNFSAMSIILHVALPTLYLADWILFHKKGQIKWYHPLSALFLPAGYILYLLIHAAIRHFDSSLLGFVGTQPLIYPYFFLNPETNGILGVVRWCILLAIAFAALGYLFWGLDRLLSNIRNKRG